MPGNAPASGWRRSPLAALGDVDDLDHHGRAIPALARLLARPVELNVFADGMQYQSQHAAKDWQLSTARVMDRAIVVLVHISVTLHCGLYAFERLAKLYADAERALQQIPATRNADAAQVLAAEAVM